MWVYRIKHGLYAWEVYRRHKFWPFYEMFSIKSFDYKRDAEKWIKEQ